MSTDPADFCFTCGFDCPSCQCGLTMRQAFDAFCREGLPLKDAGDWYRHRAAQAAWLRARKDRVPDEERTWFRRALEHAEYVGD